MAEVKKMDKIEEKAQEVKRITDKLLHRIAHITCKLSELLEKYGLDDKDTLERFDFKDFGFRWIRSNIGADLDVWSLMEDGYPYHVIPYNREDIGRCSHLHGDYNAPFCYMEYDEVKRFAEILPEFLQHFEDTLEELREEVENLPKVELVIEEE